MHNSRRLMPPLSTSWLRTSHFMCLMATHSSLRDSNRGLSFIRASVCQHHHVTGPASRKPDADMHKPAAQGSGGRTPSDPTLVGVTWAVRVPS
ncbi:hypothetical protein E2C01_019817 [Portunus trituberculatus]|uniref:Uncharacterized protein n=1 Tax=Portunus trituberculatus TaxID=210409 RepID=A0A5B7DYN4_PORTR|nr:hypothetical protein [Portunus trituberculatus]